MHVSEFLIGNTSIAGYTIDHKHQASDQSLPAVSPFFFWLFDFEPVSLSRRFGLLRWVTPFFQLPTSVPHVCPACFFLWLPFALFQKPFVQFGFCNTCTPSAPCWCAHLRSFSTNLHHFFRVYCCLDGQCQTCLKPRKSPTLRTHFFLPSSMAAKCSHVAVGLSFTLCSPVVWPHMTACRSNLLMHNAFLTLFFAFSRCASNSLASDSDLLAVATSAPSFLIRLFSFFQRQTQL